MEKRSSFEYGRALVVGRLVILLGLSAFSVVLLAAFPSFPLEALALLVAALGAYLIVFVASPLRTAHWLTRSRLILRQGWYFRAIIPLSSIESAGPAEDIRPGRVPLGIHRPLNRLTLYVTCGRSGLITLRLSEPRRFWQSLGLLANEIVFDVREPERFLGAMRERRGLLAPVESHGPDAQLRDEGHLPLVDAPRHE